MVIFLAKFCKIFSSILVVLKLHFEIRGENKISTVAEDGKVPFR